MHCYKYLYQDETTCFSAIAEREMYANTYQKYFHLLVNQLLINGKKIYKLTTLAKKFTRLIRKHDDDTAEDFR